MVANDLRARVKSRLNYLKISAFEADRRGGFHRGYVRALLAGDKDGIRKENLNALARALECTVAYLTGHQDEAHANQNDAQQGISVILTCETDTWRPLRAGEEPSRSIPVLPDPRWPGIRAFAVEARGDGADLAGISDRSFAVAVDFLQLSANGFLVRDGMLCVAKRHREQFDGVEHSIRRIRTEAGGVVRLSAPSSSEYREITLGESRGESVVILAIVSGIYTEIT